MRGLSRRRLLFAGGGGLLGYLGLASTARSENVITLRVVSETPTTITLGWDSVAGAAGYRYSAEKQAKFSHTWDPATTQVKFAKGSAWYKVEAVGVNDTGVYPPVIVPPPQGNVIKVNGSITPAALLTQINAAPAGALTVAPADGQSGYTISGDVRLTRSGVTFKNATMRDFIADGSGHGFVIDGCTVHSFLLGDVNNWTIQNSNAPFNGVTYGPQAGFDVNGGSIMRGCKNWQMLNTKFSGCYVANNPSQHTEAWFIGGGNDGGLIKGCTFDDNGTTGHLFFTYWFGSATDPATQPKNICVRECAFTRSHNPFHHIDMRSQGVGQEIPASNNIRIDPACTWDKSAAALAADSAWVRACP